MAVGRLYSCAYGGGQIWCWGDTRVTTGSSMPTQVTGATWQSIVGGVDHVCALDADNNLVRTMAGYNGGPGNVARWDSTLNASQDPLLYIALIPLNETRDFVQRVLANYWMYQIRLGQPTPSLDQIAAHEWPRYTAQDVAETIHQRSAGRLFRRRTFGDRVPFGALLAVALAGLLAIAYILWSSSTGSLKVDREHAAPHGSAAVLPP